MKVQRRHGRGSVRSTVAVIVGIVGAGVLAAGLLNDPRPEPVAIPGCAEVAQPEDLQRINFAFVTDGSYDNSWLSKGKATAMSDALAAAIPAGVAIKPDPPMLFEPSGNGDDTTAYGELLTAGRLSVSVRRSDLPPGLCLAGYVDERRTMDDGTVIDTSTSEMHSRVAVYAPDGTRIDASAEGALTLAQLEEIATTPGLRVSEPPAAGN